MKAELTPRMFPRRGAEVSVGGVYVSRRNGRPCYKVVIAVVPREGNRPWSNTVFLHIAATGDIIGSSMQPYDYVKDHMDLIGRANDLPSFKIEWLKEGDGK